MKRIFSILFNTLAVITLLVTVTVPHHHHGDTVCVVASHCEHSECEYDGRDCRTKYSSHHHDDQKTSDNDCIAKTSYVASNQNELIYKIRPHGEYNHNILFVPVFLCLFNVHCTGTKYTFLTKRRYEERFRFHEPENVNRINGLRAPPYSIA